MNEFLILIGVVVLIFFVGIFFLVLRRKPKLSAETLKRYTYKINQCQSLDPAHSVLESHKLFVSAIATLQKDPHLTAAKRIAKIQNRFPNIQKIWIHHRLRNRIAHDIDLCVIPLQAENARKDFVRALQALGK